VVELLHLTNGESAATTLRETGLGGVVLAWQDTLHEGPVPQLPRRELLRARAQFLAGCGWGHERVLLATLEARDTQLVDAFRDGVHVVLWFEHDLYDQLQLLDVLALAHEFEAAPELIVVGSFLGELAAAELEALWLSRRPADGATLETAASVWSAFREPEPTSLAEWAARDAPGLPFLAAALRRLLEELPAPGDGLSRTERQALETVAAGADTALASFVASQSLEGAAFLGDSWFYRTLRALGQGEARLLEGEPLRLTTLGERALGGEVDRVELLGIDRWLGGTHLTPDNVWRWDAAALQLVRD
jgi:hypothetical protein